MGVWMSDEWIFTCRLWLRCMACFSRTADLFIMWSGSFFPFFTSSDWRRADTSHKTQNSVGGYWLLCLYILPTVHFYSFSLKPKRCLRKTKKKKTQRPNNSWCSSSAVSPIDKRDCVFFLWDLSQLTSKRNIWKARHGRRDIGCQFWHAYTGSRCFA